MPITITTSDGKTIDNLDEIQKGAESIYRQLNTNKAETGRMTDISKVLCNMRKLEQQDKVYQFQNDLTYMLTPEFTKDFVCILDQIGNLKQRNGTTINITKMQMRQILIWIKNIINHVHFADIPLNLSVSLIQKVKELGGCFGW